ncbi:MAG: hypothetical protein CMO97_02650 [Woeseia sp.]|nr:hypothetical protein [Woeseia sp.]
MSEATIGHLVEILIRENETTRSDNKENTKQLISLNKTFNNYFKSLKQDDLDEAEEKREKKEKVSGKDFSSKIGDMAKDAGGFGFLGIVGAILFAITGLVAGIIKGIVDSFKLLTALTDRAFGRRITQFRKGLSTRVSALFRPITGFFDAIADAFRKAGTGKFVRGNQYLGRLVKPLTDFFIFVKRVGDGFRQMGRNFKAFFLSFSVIRQQLRNFRSVFDAFTPIAKEGGKVGKYLAELGKVVKPFFNIFARLGRFLGGPITLAIFSLVDGIFGAFKGFTETAGSLPVKILGAIQGFGAGIISGFVGGLLDLGKMLVGFIAGLFGFDGVKEALASFSFREMIFDGIMFPFRALMSLFDGEEGNMFSDLASSMIQGIVDIFATIKNFVVDKFKAVGRSIAGFFGFGGGDEESTAPEPIQEQPVKLEAPKETIPEELQGGMSLQKLDMEIARKERAQRQHDNRLDLIQMGEKGRGRFAKMSAEERDSQFDRSLDRRNDLEMELAELRRIRNDQTGSVGGSNINVQNSSNTALLDDTPSAMDSMDRSYAPA